MIRDDSDVSELVKPFELSALASAFQPPRPDQLLHTVAGLAESRVKAAQALQRKGMAGAAAVPTLIESLQQRTFRQCLNSPPGGYITVVRKEGSSLSDEELSLRSELDEIDGSTRKATLSALVHLGNPAFIALSENYDTLSVHDRLRLAEAAIEKRQHSETELPLFVLGLQDKDGNVRFKFAEASATWVYLLYPTY